MREAARLANLGLCQSYTDPYYLNCPGEDGEKDGREEKKQTALGPSGVDQKTLSCFYLSAFESVHGFDESDPGPLKRFKESLTNAFGV